MFVAFDVDENTFQKVQKAEREQRLDMRGGAEEIPAEMGLSVHGNDYPLKGTIKFINNQVDPKTGTIRMKAEFANPKPEKGARVLSTGMFARIRVPIGKEHKAMLIPDSAILTDQGKSYALIVGADKKAVRLDLVTGAVVDGYRVIDSVKAPDDQVWRPVNPTEQFIVTGLQRVRAGMVVDPKPLAAQ
jgi:multidrug efflux pump subunit AcrA (membrane-fusion protein)